MCAIFFYLICRGKSRMVLMKLDR